MTNVTAYSWTQNPAAIAPAMAAAPDRVGFVDYGKGLCIILVVMMHSTLGVGIAMGGEGWMHYVVEFSKPFRMPDFFLIAGLFLARTIDAPWRKYLDRKVLHFAYFYLLWTFLQLSAKAGALADPSLFGFVKAYAWQMLEPGTTLWFIHLLPIFFLVTRFSRALPWQAVLIAACLLETAQLHGYGTVVTEFASRFVYFYAGYRFAPQIFALARHAAARPAASLICLALWALVNGLLVFAFAVGDKPLAHFHGISLVTGFSGAIALIVASALLAEFGLLKSLRWLGTRSLTVYLAFFLFMAASRIVLVKTGLITDIGTVSALVTLSGLIGPLILALIVARTPAKYLFVRPQWAQLKQTD